MKLLYTKNLIDQLKDLKNWYIYNLLCSNCFIVFVSVPVSVSV
jgi:hypothetical protein